MQLQERREDLAEESSKGAPTEYDRIRLLLYILSESTDFQNDSYRLKLKEGKEELTEEECDGASSTP